MRAATFISALALAALAASLRASACQPPNCDNVDLGSCGNACCGVQFTTASSPEDVLDAITKELLAGGPDGRYALQPTAESPGTKNFTDLRPFNLPQYYLGQSTHTTAVKHYVDAINWSISPGVSGKGAVLFGFSVSGIAGALGDSGQNYKNVVSVPLALTSLKFQPLVVYGCGGPAPSPEATPFMNIARPV